MQANAGQIVLAGLLSAILAVFVLENHFTRKALHAMSLALDNLTVQVTAIEANASAAVAAIGALQAAGENAPALDALTSRLKVASDGLAAALAPKA